MWSCAYAIILTLVLLLTCGSAAASPHKDVPIVTNNTAEISSAPNSTDETNEVSENLAITAAPKLEQNVISDLILKYNKSDYYYSYRKEFAIQAGVILGVVDSSDDKDFVNYVLGFNYVLPRAIGPRWSIGADLLTTERGHLHLAKRKIYNEKGAFRPFYEAGLLHKIVPRENLAGLSNIENFLLWGVVGFSDIQQPPRSVQCQLQVALGLTDILIMITYGYSWGF